MQKTAIVGIWALVKGLPMKEEKMWAQPMIRSTRMSSIKMIIRTTIYRLWILVSGLLRVRCGRSLRGFKLYKLMWCLSSIIIRLRSSIRMLLGVQRLFPTIKERNSMPNYKTIVNSSKSSFPILMMGPIIPLICHPKWRQAGMITMIRCIMVGNQAKWAIGIRGATLKQIWLLWSIKWRCTPWSSPHTTL